MLKQWVANLATVIAFAFAGAKDKFVPAERSQPMVGAIRDAGGRQVELKVHPNEWQAASQIVVSRDAYVDWMFKQQRSAS